jgi:GAF domain-containing protein
MTDEALEHDLTGIFNSLSEIPLLYKNKYEALKKLTELGRQALKSYACTLVFLDLGSGYLTTEACAGFDEEFEKHIVGRNIKIGSIQNGDCLDFAVMAEGEGGERYDLQLDGQGLANPETARKYNLKSVLAFPLKSEGELIGYFNHFSSNSDKFTEQEKKLIKIFGYHAVTTIERFNQIRTLDRSVHVLNDLSQSLLSDPPDKFLDQVSAKAAELLDVPICIVWKLNKQDSKLHIVATTEGVDDEYKAIELEPSSRGIKKHLSDRKVGYLHDVTKRHQMFDHHQEAKKRGWVSLLSAPMWVKDEVIGMLDIFTERSRNFKDWEKELFGTFANHAALSIQKADLLKENEMLAEIRRLKERDQLVTDIKEAVDGITKDSTPVEGELKEILYTIVKKCAEVTQAKTSVLRIWNKATDHLELKAFYDENIPRDHSYKNHKFRIGEGIAGHVAKTGEPYICNDTSTDTKCAKFIIGTELTSILCVPIKSGDAVIGTLSIGGDNKEAFGTDEQELLESIIGSVTIAIERANLTDSLLRLGEATNQAASVEDLLNQIVELTRNLMSERVCLLWLLDKDKNGFTVKALAGPEGQEVDSDNLFIDNQATGMEWFLQMKEPLYSSDASKVEKHPYADRIKELCWKSMLTMPLSLKGRAIGILEVYSYKEKRNFTSWHRRLFKTWAVQTSTAIVNLRSRNRLEKLNEITQKMASASDVSDLLNLILDKGLELVGSQRGWISKLDLQTGRLENVTTRGVPAKVYFLNVGEGITGKAIQDEKPVLVHDVTKGEWPGIYKPYWDDTRSELAVPILIPNAEARIGRNVSLKTKPIGVINIESPTVAAFSEADEYSLSSLANMAALIIERLEFDRKLTEVTQIEREIVGQRDYDQIIKHVLEVITQTLGFDFVNISLVKPELNSIQSEYVTGISESEKEVFKRMANHPLTSNDIQAEIVRTGEIEVPDVNDNRFDPKIFKQFRHESMLRVFIPMIVSSDNRTIGTVEAGFDKGYRRYIYEQDIQILKGFVDYAVRALEKRERGLLERISHEFRAPIVGLRSNVDYINTHIKVITDDKLERKFEDMFLDCRTLLHQIEELEYILGGPSPIPEKELTVVYRDIVIKTINQLKPLVTEQFFDMSKIEYNSADSHKIRIYVDGAKLNQVVYNLLTNSIKYAEKDPNKFAIRIKLEENRDYFIIIFKDWGIGITKGLEEKIFELGFRTPEAHRKNVTGSGLGLTIARRIMRGIKGDLVLANNYKPTEFHMLIPKSLKEVPNDTFR